MAKLPTAQDLGTRVPQDRSAVVSGNLDYSGFQAVGNALQNIGKTVQERQDVMNMQRAKTQWQKAKIEADNAFDHDNDFATYAERYNGMLSKASEDALKQVTNPRMKELLTMDIELSKADGIQRMNDRAFAKERESGLATLQEILTVNRENALRSKTDADKMAALDQMNDAIATAELLGYVSKDDGQALRTKSGQDMAKAMVSVQPLEKQLEMLRSGKGYASIIPTDDRMAMIERTESQIVTNQLLAERQRNTAIKRAYLGALDSVDQTGSTSGIPDELWTNFNASQRKGLREYAESLAGGKYIPTNYKRYYELVRMSQQDPAGFVQLDLGADRMNLGNTEFKQLANKQVSLLEGAGSQDDPEFDSVLREKDAVDKSLKAIIKKTPTKYDEADNDFANAFYRIYDGEKKLWLARNPDKKDLPPEERDKLLDELTRRSFTESDSWFSSGKIRSEQPGLAGVDDDTIEEIKADLQSAGMPVNAYNIYKAYANAKAAGKIK